VASLSAVVAPSASASHRRSANGRYDVDRSNLHGPEQEARLGFSQYVVCAGLGLARATELAERISPNPPLRNFPILRALPLIARSEPEASLLLEGLLAAATINAEARNRAQAFLNGKAVKAIPATGNGRRTD
jgi:hypothetical protein